MRQGDYIKKRERIAMSSAPLEQRVQAIEKLDAEHNAQKLALKQLEDSRSDDYKEDN